MGDTVRVEWTEDDVTPSRTGVVAGIDGDGTLRSPSCRAIGPYTLRQLAGRTVVRADLIVYLLDRPAPTLPTEPGSMIVDATIRGIEGRTAILNDCGIWNTPRNVRGHRSHSPEHITAWTPARIVADGEPVTR
ncbi:hypothetical protein EDD28_3464 [Salana multivorans]|uniref:Uncharacterized protein n=1 Tax=Salana multivorans TaxID=120377 RepID=A0A3N2D3G0_9MICO|nr:hypothetical protein EDD28_3464 [Salana multivorans]